MKSFLRENPTIAFGLGLPLLLVVVFLLISGIPTLLVDPPQHDVLYATGFYNDQEGLQIAVVDQKVQVNYRGIVQSRANTASVALLLENRRSAGNRDFTAARPEVVRRKTRLNPATSDNNPDRCARSRRSGRRLIKHRAGWLRVQYR